MVDPDDQSPVCSMKEEPPVKTAKRVAAMMLVLALLLTNGGVAAFAEAVFTLPTALEIIEEEAFYGSSSIDKVVLSNRVTEIRARAFANSTLSEINLPDSITYIAEDAFDGPDKVTVTANRGTYTYRWAVEHKYITEETKAVDLTVSPDMLTLAVGSTYALSCALVPSDVSTASVTWSSSDDAVASVAQGTITAKAEGKAVITAASDNGLTATCEVKVTRSIPAPDITSAAQDGMGAVTLSWDDLGSDCEYMVYEQKDGALTLLGSTAKPSYTVYAASAGTHTYSVQACVRDQDGILVSSEESAAYGVDVALIWSFGASIENIKQVSGDTVSMTWRGVSPVSYYEIAEMTADGYEITAGNLTGDTASVQQVSPGVHRYAIRAVWVDQNNQAWVSGWSSAYAIAMLSAEALAPVAPVLVFDEPEMAFSAEEANAPEYERGSIDIAWLPNEYARSYSLTVEKKTATGYTLVAEESDIATTAHILSATLFDDVTERTIYRFGICSQGDRSGEYAYSYFAVTVPDPSISVSSNRWERTSKYAGSRVFTVTSELPWTATADADWMTLAQDEAALEVRLSEYSLMGSAARTGVITLTNGENTTNIAVVQGRASDAPVLSLFGQVLSTDINNPTEIPAGGFSLGIDDNGANQILMRFAQKTNGSYGGWQQKQITNKDYIVYPYEWNAITFSAGKEFCIEASGHYSSDKNNYADYEIADDAPAKRYYIKLVDQGYYLLIKGQDKLELTVFDSESVDVLSSNSWSAASDSSWLTFSSTRETERRKQTLHIYAEANYTGSERTGHITLTCGPKSAVITVHQPDLTPRVISPANLSQTESAPTSVGAGTFFFTAVGYKITWEYKDGAAWVDPVGGSLYETSDEFDIVEGYIESDLFETGKTYRLTAIDTSGKTAAYYLKRSSTTSAYIQLGLEEYRSFNKPAGASTETVTLKSSGSWSVTSDASWLTASPTSGKSGSGQKVTVSVAANTTAAERIGVLSFKIGSTVYAKLKMTQAAAGTDYVDVFVDNIPVAQTNALNHVTGAGVSLDIRPYAPGKITAASSAAWLTVKDEISSGASANVKVAENDSGARRSGTITFSYGTASKTITMTQEPYLSSVTLMSPSLSTDDAAPTVLTYSDSPITMKWNGVANAVRYYVELWKGNEYHDLVVENAGATNTATLPADWFDPAYTGQYELDIWPIDAYGNDGADQWYYFTRAAGNAVYIDGKTAVTWDNVSDLCKTAEYTVASSAAWTAIANVSWISLGATSGANGDVLSVTAARNLGAARTGKVTVKSGSATAVLTVNQCAVLPEYPQLKTPTFSEDIANPTVLSKTDTLTVTWDIEPQAERYQVWLGSVTNSSTMHIIEKSGYLTTKETYTFTISGLIEGQTYLIELTRAAENADGNVKTTSTRYYFTIAPAVPFISLDGVDATEMDESYRTFWADGTEDHIRYTIGSSGTWTATVSDSSWMMVARSVKTAAYLTENEKESTDYAQYTGNSGDSLYISVLDNDTGNTRYGTVTITTAGASTTLFVEQEQHYVLPEITSPTLATKPSASIEIPYGDISLQWTAGESNTGVYDVTLYEKEDRSFYQIYTKKGLSARSLTIPSSKLKENTYYKIYLETKLENSGETCGQYYYFHTSSANALTVSASVDWSQVDNGGYVDINASASGGAGNYRYAYQLLLDGAVEQETAWETLKNYQFKPWSNGNYQVKVIVKDATEKQVTYLSDGYAKEDESTISVATTNHYTASLNSNYQLLDYKVLSPRTWSVKSSPDWVTPSVTGVTFSDTVRLVIAKNDGVTRIGKVEFQSNTGIISDLTITQTGSRSVAMVAAEETVTSEAQSVQVAFAASARWTASSDSSWATLGTKTGSSGNRTITVSLAENTDTAERSAVISVISNGDVGQYTIRQLGKAIEQGDLKLSDTSWLLPSMAAAIKTFTVTTSGSWSISAIPDWMSANVSSGEGSGDVSLYCSSNTEQSARSGMVTISSGSLTQSIHVSQPGNDVLASVTSFTMSKNNVMTGENVSFEIETMYADQVQLIVDGRAYDVKDVVDNKVIFTRAFTSEGLREVSIMPLRLGNCGVISTPIMLNVTSIGALTKPSIEAINDVLIGQDVICTWGKVPNATEYTVYFSDGYTYSRYTTTAETSALIKGEEIQAAGNYSVEVIATAMGYTQSSGTMDFCAINPIVDFAVVTPKENNGFETHDPIDLTADNPSGFWLRYKITYGTDTWYVPSGACVNTPNAKVNWFAPETAGTYSITAVAYANQYSQTENWWGETSKAVHIYVKSGTITWLSVADIGFTFIQKGQNVADKEKMKNVSLQTNLGVEKIDIKLDGTVVGTLTKNEGTLTSSTYYRNYSYVMPMDLDEGMHTYQFIATDKDGKEYATKLYQMYAYTSITPAQTVYPNSKSVEFKKKPADKNGTVLALDDKLTVMGNCGSYFYCKKGDENVGFVAKAETGNEQIVDWASVELSVLSLANEDEALKIYALPDAYNVTFKWLSNMTLPSCYGYNAYLVPAAGSDGHTVKLNDMYVNGNELTVKTHKIATFYDTDEWHSNNLYALLQVDIVDMRNNTVMKSATSKGECAILTYANCFDVMQEYQKWIQRTVANHDIIYCGNATVDGVQYTSRTIKEVTGIGKLYSATTGDIGDVPLTSVTQGALMAEAIMKDIASTRHISVIDLSSFKKLLDVIGFDMNAIEAVEKHRKNMYRDLLNLYTLLDKDHEHGGEIEKMCKEWEKMFDQYAAVHKFNKVFNEVKKGLEPAIAMASFLEEYFTYRSVRRSDVQVYIDQFKGSEVPALEKAADYLAAMTENDMSLLGYLLRAYGFNAGKDWAFTAAYETVMNALPLQFRSAIKGATLVNNFFFNTKETLEKAYEVDVLSQQCEVARREFEDYYKTFESDPAKYYHDMISRQNVYMSLLEIELNAFNEFASTNDQGAVGKLINAMLGKTTPQINVPVIISLYENGLNEQLNAVYATWIAPYN